MVKIYALKWNFEGEVEMKLLVRYFVLHIFLAVLDFTKAYLTNFMGPCVVGLTGIPLQAW